MTINSIYVKKIIDADTQEETIVPMTKEEIVAHQAEETKQQLLLEAAQQAALDLAALKASAKAKLIAGEPLTAAEADTLVI